MINHKQIYSMLSLNNINTHPAAIQNPLLTGPPNHLPWTDVTNTFTMSQKLNSTPPQSATTHPVTQSHISGHSAGPTAVQCTTPTIPTNSPLQTAPQDGSRLAKEVQEKPLTTSGAGKATHHRRSRKATHHRRSKKHHSPPAVQKTPLTTGGAKKRHSPPAVQEKPLTTDGAKNATHHRWCRKSHSPPAV